MGVVAPDAIGELWKRTPHEICWLCLSLTKQRIPRKR